MNGYSTAWDSLCEAIGHGQGISSGSIGDLDGLSTDQRLKVAEVAALLSIAEELSVLNDQSDRKQKAGSPMLRSSQNQGR